MWTKNTSVWELENSLSRENEFILSTLCVLSRPPVGDAHLHWGWSSFLSLLTQMLISSRDTPRNNVLAAIWAFLSLVKSTHKINRHMWCHSCGYGTFALVCLSVSLPISVSFSLARFEEAGCHESYNFKGIHFSNNMRELGNRSSLTQVSRWDSALANTLTETLQWTQLSRPWTPDPKKPWNSYKQFNLW